MPPGKSTTAEKAQHIYKVKYKIYKIKTKIITVPGGSA